MPAPDDDAGAVMIDRCDCFGDEAAPKKGAYHGCLYAAWTPADWLSRAARGAAPTNAASADARDGRLQVEAVPSAERLADLSDNDPGEWCYIPRRVDLAQ